MNTALRNYALVKRINGDQDPELERLVNEEEENKCDEVDHKIRDFARYEPGRLDFERFKRERAKILSKRRKILQTTISN